MGTYPDHRSVLILDNWAGHRNATFLNFCFDLNIMVEYGVPYAPDIMVHEPCGGSAKWQMKKYGAEWRRSGYSTRQQIELAFNSVDAATVRARARDFGFTSTLSSSNRAVLPFCRVVSWTGYNNLYTSWIII